MLNEIIISYWGVLVAAVASFIIGAIWYTLLFGKTWVKLSGVEMGKGKSPAMLYIINFVATLIIAWVLAHTIKYSGAGTSVDALMVGFFTWLGYFALATLLGSILWEGKPFKLYLINAGYWLVNIEVMSLILALWK